MHTLQQNALDCHVLLPLELRVLRDDWLRVRQIILEAFLEVLLPHQSNLLLSADELLPAELVELVVPLNLLLKLGQ